MIHELEPFTKVNVFVGRDVYCIDRLRTQFDRQADDPRTYMGFGDGMHHTSVYTELRIALNCAANGHDVFMYVNSMDVIKALPDIVRELNLQDDFRLTRIGKSAKTSTKGEPIAINYTLGLTPKRIRQEQRFQEVCGAIAGYYDAGKKIPIEWVEEHNELVDTLSAPRRKMNSCIYCDESTDGTLTLGRGDVVEHRTCCQRCYDEVNELSEHRKSIMAEYAFIHKCIETR